MMESSGASNMKGSGAGVFMLGVADALLEMWWLLPRRRLVSEANFGRTKQINGPCAYTRRQGRAGSREDRILTFCGNGCKCACVRVPAATAATAAAAATTTAGATGAHLPVGISQPHS